MTKCRFKSCRALQFDHRELAPLGPAKVQPQVYQLCGHQFGTNMSPFNISNMNIHPAQDPVAVEHRRLAIQVAVAVSIVVTLLTTVVTGVGLIDQYRHDQPLSVINALRELQPERTGWAP